MKTIKKLLALVPPHMGIPLMFALAWNCFVFYFPRLFTAGMKHYDMTSSLDRAVPVLSWTVVIYFGCYIFWGLNYIMACRQSKEMGYRVLSADFLAKVVSLVFFFAIPTTLARPENIEVHNIFDRLLRYLYSIDSPDNLFPSLHCMVSWFCVIAVRRNPTVPRWYRIFSYIFTFMIFITVLTTKQHVIADIFAGVFIAELCYQLTDAIGFSGLYRRVHERIFRIAKDTE